MVAEQEERRLLEELTNEVPSIYAPLIAEDPLYSLDTPYADQLTDDLQLSRFARNFSSAVGGKDFVDLGCAVPYIVMRVALEFGARKYVGVDKNLYYKTHDMDNGFPAIFVEDDILRFVSRIPTNRGHLSFFLSGLQPVVEDDDKLRAGIDYLRSLVSEIARASIPGDAAILETLATPSLVGECFRSEGYVSVPSHEIITFANGHKMRKDPRYVILKKCHP